MIIFDDPYQISSTVFPIPNKSRKQPNIAVLPLHDTGCSPHSVKNSFFSFVD
jgi:hypothetical protein